MPRIDETPYFYIWIKTNQASVLGQMANAVISSGMKSRLYTKDLTGETLLEDFQNRIIILVDKPMWETI